MTKPPPRRPWTTAELAVIRATYPHQPTRDIAKALRRPETQIYGKASALGLHKAAEYFASGQGGRLDGLRGAGCRFKPGHTTWNKGLTGLNFAGSQATQFKAGQQPHNTRPVGEYRIDKQGTLQRKISAASGSNSQRWRGVHELVWIEAHGPVPQQHLVVFRPGMRTTKLDEITLDRVECISRAENMRRNSYHNYPKELAQAIRLRGALVRAINQRLKNEDSRDERDDRHPAQ